MRLTFETRFFLFCPTRRHRIQTGPYTEKEVAQTDNLS